MSAKFRILNYPQDIEGCHDLIKILVAELNEGASTANNSIPLAGDKEYCPITPAGMNADNAHNIQNNSWNFSFNYGGVTFEGVGGHRPPLAHDRTVRGSSYGTTCCK